MDSHKLKFYTKRFFPRKKQPLREDAHFLLARAQFSLLEHNSVLLEHNAVLLDHNAVLLEQNAVLLEHNAGWDRQKYAENGRILHNLASVQSKSIKIEHGITISGDGLDLNLKNWSPKWKYRVIEKSEFPKILKKQIWAANFLIERLQKQTLPYVQTSISYFQSHIIHDFCTFSINFLYNSFLVFHKIIFLHVPMMSWGKRFSIFFQDDPRPNTTSNGT